MSRVELLRNQRIQFAAAAAMLLLAVVVVVASLVGGDSKQPLRSPDVLLRDATSTGDSDAERSRRRKAARELVQQAAVATEALRQLADESDDAAVRATAMQGLGKARDRDSVPMLLDALEDDDPRVRGQANAALIKIYEADFGFRAYDSADKRAASVRLWRQAVGQP